MRSDPETVLMILDKRSETLEAYVSSFPSGNGKWQISTNGGNDPHWRRDGKELFFISWDDILMSAEIISGQNGSPVVGKIQSLFRTHRVALRVGSMKSRRMVVDSCSIAWCNLPRLSRSR